MIVKNFFKEKYSKTNKQTKLRPSSVKGRVLCPLGDQSIKGGKAPPQASTGGDALELTSESPQVESGL